ncbi:MAG: transcription-repair coupling factor [Actinomycetota bacterium]
MSNELGGLLELWDSTDLLEAIREEGQAGVPDVARPAVVAGLARRARGGPRCPAPLLVVLPRSREAEAFVAALDPWMPRDRVALFPAWEVLPGEALSPTLETMGRRIRVVRDLAAGAETVVVTSVRALLQKVPRTSHEALRLAVGMQIPLEEVTERLVRFGFERNYLIERPGEFSVRGGILDVLPPGLASPVRADFFGDEITTLRAFSLSSQRSQEGVSEVEILPTRELLLDPPVREAAAALIENGRLSSPQARADLERLAAGIPFAGMEAYLGTLGTDLAFIAERLGGSGTIILADPKQCRDRSLTFLAQASEWGAEQYGDLFGAFDEALADAGPIELWPYRRGEEGLDLDITGWDEHLGHPDELSQSLRRHQAQGATVAIAAGRPVRVRQVLAEAGLGLPIAAPGARFAPGQAAIHEASVPRGYLLRSAEKPLLALVGEADLFGKRRAPSPTPARDPRDPQARRGGRARASALLLELAPGDYLVHEMHGVGRYLGMVTRELAGINRDYLLMEYKGDDRLYVPVEQLEAVTRYSGGEAPRLNRLGSGEWERARSRARRAVREIAQELVVLYAKRLHAKGHAFSPDTPWQQELEDAFPHLETPDQLRAIEEVKADMQRPVPMDRLILGDVGYGKTEIAIRAAFRAVQDGKQVAVLVPTTILAAQHEQTFQERFAGYPVRVAQLSRFLSDREVAEVKEGLATGRIDVVIGTHRLLQPDVKFHALGLVVVDEEQRFGVRHKEALKRLRTSVDCLTLSATPIPRTLEMAITGIRDMSTVDTPPLDRRPVLTYVGSYDERMVLAAIRRELAREGQVFYIHNRVRSIRAAARRIRALVPQARMEIAHGQMNEADLEGVMGRVWDGKLDVLVCTTIIESGLDIPAMNTLVVERADRLGLAQLYQLRGRVGRASERAYAYFFYPHEAVLTEEAHERLKTLSEFTELGSGFKIALRDLEIRGAGSLLGAEQSGHIAAVGFDLFVRMMGEAVRDLSGEPAEPRLEVRIDLPVDAYIPPDYIARESLRIETYRQIEAIRSPEGAQSLAQELEDRYGALPPPVRNLLGVAELRAFLAELSCSEATLRNGVLKVRPFPRLAPSQEVRLQRRFPGAAHKPATDTLLLPTPGGRPGNALDAGETPDPSRDLTAWVLSSLRAILA